MFNYYIKKNGELDSPFTAGGQNGHFFFEHKNVLIMPGLI